MVASGDTPPVGPSEGEAQEQRLWAQYVIAVEEYRFQVDLNWRRSQYFFVLCTAILAAAFTLLDTASGIPDALVALVFVASTMISGLGFLASQTQRGYYRAARDLKGVLENELGLGNLALRTTTGMGGSTSRIARVTTFQNVGFGLLAVLGVAGALAAAGVFGSIRPASEAGVKTPRTTWTSRPGPFDRRAGSPGQRHGRTCVTVPQSTYRSLTLLDSGHDWCPDG